MKQTVQKSKDKKMIDDPDLSGEEEETPSDDESSESTDKTNS